MVPAVLVVHAPVWVLVLVPEPVVPRLVRLQAQALAQMQAYMRVQMRVWWPAVTRYQEFRVEQVLAQGPLAERVTRMLACVPGRRAVQPFLAVQAVLVQLVVPVHRTARGRAVRGKAAPVRALSVKATLA